MQVPRVSYIARATADLRGTELLYENVVVYACLQRNIDLFYVMNVDARYQTLVVSPPCSSVCLPGPKDPQFTNKLGA
jgi:hypothetical protein